MLMDTTPGFRPTEPCHTGASRCPERRADSGFRLSPERRAAFFVAATACLETEDRGCQELEVAPLALGPFDSGVKGATLFYQCRNLFRPWSLIDYRYMSVLPRGTSTQSHRARAGRTLAVAVDLPGRHTISMRKLRICASTSSATERPRWVVQSAG